MVRDSGEELLREDMRSLPLRLYLKAGVVVIWVFRFPYLHLHSWLLHELAGSQGHGPQHVLSAALEHLLQDLVGHTVGQDKAGLPVGSGGSIENLPQPTAHPGVPQKNLRQFSLATSH